MRFGLFLPQGWRLDLVGIDPADHWATISGLAVGADSGPWESVWVYDHLHTFPHTETESTHEAWTLMAALAATTERVRLGQMCTCMAYRNPAYLAKVAATTDLISGGRLEMGIGAGWYEQEFVANGYEFPSAGDRLGMLDEGVQIFRQAWTEGRATLDGKHYQVTDAICEPRPLQDGGIPLWIAGGGEKKTLRIAAEHAKYTNFDGTPEGFAHKSRVLERHCEAIGRDVREITRSANYNVIVARTEAEVDEKLDRLGEHLSRFVGPDEADKHLGAFRGLPAVGTPEQIVDALGKVSELGMEYGIFYFPFIADDPEDLGLFESEVIPKLG